MNITVDERNENLKPGELNTVVNITSTDDYPTDIRIDQHFRFGQLGPIQISFASARMNLDEAKAFVAGLQRAIEIADAHQPAAVAEPGVVAVTHKDSVPFTMNAVVQGRHKPNTIRDDEFEIDDMEPDTRTEQQKIDEGYYTGVNASQLAEPIAKLERAAVPASVGKVKLTKAQQRTLKELADGTFVWGRGKAVVLNRLKRFGYWNIDEDGDRRITETGRRALRGE
jgi:hypothetical protein